MRTRRILGVERSGGRAMLPRLLGLSATVLLASSVGFPQSASRPDGDKPIVLRATRLFDGKSDRVVSPGMVVVSGARIQAVGATASIPATATVINLGDSTLGTFSSRRAAEQHERAVQFFKRR